VVLALLTLVLAAAPATRSLGLHAACGLLVALVFVLLVLPPLLGLFGRRLFSSGLTDPIQVIGATGRANRDSISDHDDARCGLGQQCGVLGVGADSTEGRP
jgi:uncharacterized membrane protein YdfJ with MMPL/SSD domain